MILDAGATGPRPVLDSRFDVYPHDGPRCEISELGNCKPEAVSVTARSAPRGVGAAPVGRSHLLLYCRQDSPGFNGEPRSELALRIQSEKACG